MGERNRDTLEAARAREAELWALCYQSHRALIHVVDQLEQTIKAKNEEIQELKLPRKPKTVTLKFNPDDTIEVSGKTDSNDADNDELLTTRAAAKRLCISERTLRRKAEKGEIKAERTGTNGNLRFRSGELDRYLHRY